MNHRRRPSILHALLFAGISLQAGTAAAETADRVLFQVTGGFLTDGQGGKLIAVQRAINHGLSECGQSLRIEADGLFGRGTAAAIRSLTACPEVAERLAPGSPAFDGAVTEGLWAAILPAASPPDVGERVRAIVLAFERTDYTRAEWNFCQNRPLYDPPANTRCVSNDPGSFLTWGPKGATAGHGQEVQTILSVVDERDPAALDRSFAAEAGAVRRLLAVDRPDVERYLCGIWLDRARRQAWRAGFAALGESELVQATYDEVYRSKSFDGGKIEAFYSAWREAGLEPSEVDFGFFVDRAVHMSISRAALAEALSEAAVNGPLPPWQARRAVSLVVRPRNESIRKDRLGRDVTFYADAGEAALTAEERQAWEERGRRRASNVGLSDGRPAPEFEAGPRIGRRPAAVVTLTTAEKSACPAEVLNPDRP